MHQEQYVIKNLYRNTIVTNCGNNCNFIRGLSQMDLREDITIDELGEPSSNCMINFFN